MVGGAVPATVGGGRPRPVVWAGVYVGARDGRYEVDVGADRSIDGTGEPDRDGGEGGDQCVSTDGDCHCATVFEGGGIGR